MANGFVHVELTTQDVDGAKDFYSHLFDWEFEDQSGEGIPPYTMIRTGSQPEGGMQPAPAPGIPSAWLAYVHVSDLPGTIEKAKEKGGNVIVDDTAIPGTGRFAVLADPSGAVFGVFTPE